MLSEGPEVGWDRHLLLQAKHSLNQQKQETLPWQTAAKKDVDTVRDTEQKKTFHSQSHSQLKDCIKLVCPLPFMLWKMLRLAAAAGLFFLN